jgi:hypothetical protein
MTARGRLVAALVVPTALATAASPPQQPVPTAAAVEARLDQLRGVTPCTGLDDCERVNKKLDAVVAELMKQKDVAGPLAAEALRRETALPHPDPFFLLDVGYVLLLMDADTYAEVSLRGLSRVDLEADVIRANFEQLFHFAHRLAIRRQPGILEFLDRLLPTREEVVIPQHALTLDPVMIAVFLYGAYGPEAEDHLLTHLSGRQKGRVLEVLNWLGSAKGVPAVEAALGRAPSRDQVQRAVGFFMRVGGPAGKRAVLGIETARLDPESQAYLAEVRPAVEAHGFEVLRERLRLEGQQSFESDDPLLAALDQDEKNGGREFGT